MWFVSNYVSWSACQEAGLASPPLWGRLVMHLHVGENQPTVPPKFSDAVGRAKHIVGLTQATRGIRGPGPRSQCAVGRRSTR
jgi:hypothetical protein